MDSNVAAVLIDLHKTGKYEGFIRGGQAPLEKSKKTGLRLSRIARDIVGANNTKDEALVVVANTFEDEIWAFPEGAFFDKGTPLEEIAERVTASGFPDWNPSVGDAVSESEIGLFFFSAENGQELLLLLDGNDDPRHQEYFKHALNRRASTLSTAVSVPRRTAICPGRSQRRFEASTSDRFASGESPRNSLLAPTSDS